MSGERGFQGRVLIIELQFCQFSLFFSLFQGVANTFYVSTTGNNNNPGTSSQPWRTIQKATNTMAAGDTVIVNTGNFTGERVQVTKSGIGYSPQSHDKLGEDPRFVSNFDNLQPRGSSPCIDAGMSIPQVTNDFNGVPRPQGAGFDIGAYEYRWVAGSPFDLRIFE